MKKGMFVLLIAVLVTACTSVPTLESLQKCEFRMQGIEDISAAGVRISGKQSISDLSVLDASRIMVALTKGSLPVRMVVDVGVRNPNRQTAALGRVEYIAYLDGNQIFSGSTTDSIKIPGNNVSSLPFNVEFDLFDLMEGETEDAILNFLFNLAGVSTVPSTFTMKVKPSISVAGIQVPYPDYLDITTQFGGN